MVYKAIERKTGEIVAIKHVCYHLLSNHPSPPSEDVVLTAATRLTSNPAKTTFKKSNKKSPSFRPAHLNS